MMQAIEKIEDCLPDDGPARASLLGEAVRLLAMLAAWPKSATYVDLIGAPAHPPITLDSARPHVARRATALPLAALLFARPDPDGLHADRLDRVRAWVLAAALAAITGAYANHSAWREAARAARHLCVGDLAAVRQRVPDLRATSPREARREIEVWAKREAEAGSAFAPRLQCIVRVLAQLGGQARRRCRWRRCCWPDRTPAGSMPTGWTGCGPGFCWRRWLRSPVPTPTIRPGARPPGQRGISVSSRTWPRSASGCRT